MPSWESKFFILSLYVYYGSGTVVCCVKSHSQILQPSCCSSCGSTSPFDLSRKNCCSRMYRWVRHFTVDIISFPFPILSKNVWFVIWLAQVIFKMRQPHFICFQFFVCHLGSKIYHHVGERYYPDYLPLADLLDC